MDTPRLGALQPVRVLPPSPSSSPFKRAPLSLSGPKALSDSPTPASHLKRPTSNPKPKLAVAYSNPKAESRSSPMRDVDIALTVTPFKVPAVPVRPARMRMMTPSTSTVAASSSPPRHDDDALSSSPSRSPRIGAVRRQNDIMARSATGAINIPLRRDAILILGRHRHHLPSTSSPSTSSASVTALIPLAHLRHIANPSLPTAQISLPRSASHASRVHCAIEYRPALNAWRVLVIGQNGVRMRVGGGKARRVRAGEWRDVSPSDNEVELDFYGSMVRLVIPSVAAGMEVDEDKLAAMFSPASSSIGRRDLPPSSPPVLPADLEGESDRELDMDVDADADADSSLSDLDAEGEVIDEIIQQGRIGAEIGDEAESLAVKKEMLEEGISGHARSRTSSPAIKPNVPLPEGVDLPALLATTVVFSGSSKLSLPDLVKHMLESQPSLRDHGEEELWTIWVNEELEGNKMFGKVQRHGKDASGRPLLPHYFYSPDSDPDAYRAKELGGLVRPLRAAQRAGGKAIDWRPVGAGRRRY